MVKQKRKMISVTTGTYKLLETLKIEKTKEKERFFSFEDIILFLLKIGD